VPVVVTEIDDVVAPVLHTYTLPALPPFAVNTAGPDEKQCVLGPLIVIVGFTQGIHSAIVALLDAVQPLASVTVTLNTPALQIPVIDWVVAPVFHTYENGAVPPLVTFAVTLAVQEYNFKQFASTLIPTTGTGLIRTRTTFDSPGHVSQPARRLQRTNQRLLHNS
jgi:hypothetical protein